MQAPYPGSWKPQALARGRRLDGRFAAGIRGEGNFLVPSLQVDEEDGVLLVVADIPGAERGELAISLKGDVLRITGERARHAEDSDERVHHTSRYLSRFTREVRLPHAVDGRRAHASFDQGVLTIRLGIVASGPKASASRAAASRAAAARRIDIAGTEA